MFDRIKKLLEFFFSKNQKEEITEKPKYLSMSENGLAVLKYFESCELEAYWDKDGKVWTVGWGDTGPDVVEGLEITKYEADQRLKNRLENEFIPGVKRLLKIEPTQGQLDGMVDLAYNIGLGAFSDSTLLRLYNQGDIQGAADQFKRWRFSGGKPLLGLYRRRIADEALFNGASGNDAVRKGASIDRIVI